MGLEVEVLRRIGEEWIARARFVLHMVEFEVQLVAGVPAVPRDESITQYVDLAYVSDPRLLVEAARLGSACSRIYLRDHGIDWR